MFCRLSYIYIIKSTLYWALELIKQKKYYKCSSMLCIEKYFDSLLQMSIRNECGDKHSRTTILCCQKIMIDDSNLYVARFSELICMTDHEHVSTGIQWLFSAVQKKKHIYNRINMNIMIMSHWKYIRKSKIKNVTNFSFCYCVANTADIYGKKFRWRKYTRIYIHNYKFLILWTTKFVISLEHQGYNGKFFNFNSSHWPEKGKSRNITANERIFLTYESC